MSIIGRIITRIKTFLSRAVCTFTLSLRCNHSNIRLELASVYMAHGVMQEAEPVTRTGNDRLVFKTVSPHGSMAGTAGLVIFNVIDGSNYPRDPTTPEYGQVVVAWKANALSWDEVPCTVLYCKERQTDFESLYDSLCEKVLCEIPPQESSNVVCSLTQWISTRLGTMCVRTVACKCKSFKSVYYAVEIENCDKDLAEPVLSYKGKGQQASKK